MGYSNLDVSLGDGFGFDTKSKGNKSKNKQVDLCQTKRLLHGKGNHQENKRSLSNGRRDL